MAELGQLELLAQLAQLVLELPEQLALLVLVVHLDSMDRISAMLTKLPQL
jgi:hypothetical protein